MKKSLCSVAVILTVVVASAVWADDDIVIASPGSPAVVGMGKSAGGFPYLREFVIYYFSTRCGSQPVISDVATALGKGGCRIILATAVEAKAAGNKVVEKAIIYAREKITEGRNISDPLKELKIFPGMVVQMIAVGEQTGALDVMCNKIADFYDEEVDVAVAALTSMLEPIMMVVIGGVVGGMVMAMYLPIFSMADTVKG